MVKEVIWTKSSLNSFKQITDYLQNKWGDKVVKSFVQRTIEIKYLLAEESQLGSVEDPSKGVRGFLLTKHVRLFYRIKHNQIIILNLFSIASTKKKY